MTKIDNIYNRAQFTELLIHVLAMNYDKIAVTAGPWHMRFFRLGKIRMSQIRMTEI